MSTPPRVMDVWVLAGQSNMEGCGPLAGALPAGDNVWAFTSAGNWEKAVDPLHRFWESYAPVHRDLRRPGLSESDAALTDRELAEREIQSRLGGTGLGIAFANDWSQATGRATGLIAAAHGGTSLDQWSQEKKDEGTRSLYGAMLDRIKRAGGQLKGILWYQGESDCNPADGASYAGRFDAWVAAARRDTGHADLPVIVVQLARYVLGVEPPEVGPNWNTIREAQRTLPERTPFTAVTTAIDLDLSDSIHVGSRGLVRLGRRLAKLALQLEASQGGATGPRLLSARARPGHYDPNYIRLEFAGVTKGWLPGSHMAGFSLHTRSGALHPLLRPVEAFADAQDPTVINVLLNDKVDADTAIAYGQGVNPYCNVVDGADMPLLTFAPIAVDPIP